MSLGTFQPEAGDDRHRGMDFSAEKLHEMWHTPSELDTVMMPNDAREITGEERAAPRHIGRTAMRIEHFLGGQYLG